MIDPEAKQALIDELIGFIADIDPICECGEPGYACICCWECGATNKWKYCVCDERVVGADL